MTHLIEYINKRPINIPAVYQQSDRMLQRALIRDLPVSLYDIVDYVKIQAGGHLPEYNLIKYKFSDNHPVNVKGTFLNIYI